MAASNASIGLRRVVDVRDSAFRSIRLAVAASRAAAAALSWLASDGSVACTAVGDRLDGLRNCSGVLLDGGNGYLTHWVYLLCWAALARL